MPESRIRAALDDWFKDAGTSIVEHRVIDYIVIELKNGRGLKEILEDPYITSKIPDNQMAHLLQHREIFDALNEQLKTYLKQTKQ